MHNHFVRYMLNLLFIILLFVPPSGSLSQDSDNQKSTLLNLFSESKHPQIKDRYMTVQIGDSTEQVYEPSFEIDLWQGECRFKVSLRNSLTPLVSDVIPRVTGSTNPEVQINYGEDISYRMFKRTDGNFEWEIILDCMPDSNRFSFNIQTCGLLFYYQPALTSEQIAAGFERPDSVIGSYAVYHNSKANNFIRVDGTQEVYRTGKSFHIYRPRAWDTVGDTVWGELLINTTAEVMTITIADDFLKRATYPVIIDPTFGNTSAGASISAPGLHNLIVLYNDYVETGAGQCDSAYIYGHRQLALFDGPIVKIYAYEHTRTYADDDFIDSTSRFQITSTSAIWNGRAMVNENNLSAGVEYVAAFQAADDVNGANTKLYYDDTNVDTVLTVADTDFNPPSNLSAATVNGLRYSVYVVYSTSAGVTNSIKRRKILTGGNK